MPVKYGGVGLTSVKDIASAAYLASWAHSAATLRKRFPTLWESPEFLVNNMNNIQVSLDNAIVEYNDSLGHSDVSQVREFCDLLVNNTKLQHRLSAQVFSSKIEMCLETAGDAKDKAHLRSVQGKGSGSWLEAVPSSEKLVLTPASFA